MGAPSPALRLRGVHAGYGGRPDILAGIDLEVQAGEAVAILGPSGGGKSTLLKAVARLAHVRRGTVEVLGAKAPARPPRGAVGYIPQRLGLVRHTSVLDNVEHGGLHETTWWQSLLHRAPAHVMGRAEAALDAVGLGDKAHEPIHQLSGGQQRRVAVARALVQRPRLLLADEFLGELDPRTAGSVAAAVRSLRESHGTAVLLVEHHQEQAQRIADRVYRLEQGRLVDAEESIHAT